MTNEFGEDSFTLTSEDDAFLAAVDLGEGDLGRPILNEDCMDFEEGLGRLDVGNDECFDENAGVNGSAAAPREPVAASSNIGMQDSSNQLQAQAPRVGFNSNQTADAAVGFPAGVLQDQRPARFTSNSSSNTSLGQGSGSNTSKVSSGHSWSNQNHNPATTNTALKRSATPSAGSFHFPPGMVRSHSLN
jgi:hypothetical protein